MGTIRPRIQTSPGLAADRSANLADRQQIRRLLSAAPKPKPAPVASGGIVGMAEVRSTSGSVVFGAGQAGMSRNGVTYGAPIDPYSGSPGASQAAPSSWLTVDGYQLLLAPGWYNIAVSLRVAWSTEGAAPSSLSLYMQGGWDVAHNDPSYFATAALGSGGAASWGIAQVASHGPTFINAGDAVYAECRGSNAPAADNDPGQSSIIWNITKLS